MVFGMKRGECFYFSFSYNVNKLQASLFLSPFSYGTTRLLKQLGCDKATR